MSLLTGALASLPVGDLVKMVADYGPAIEALIQFIEKVEDDKIRAQSMDSITRGLQYASQTGDTSLLESAIRAHCGAAGCELP